MDRVHVSSSNIASIGYDATAQILEIQFHNGGVYQYSNVPPSVHMSLMSAGSHGQYFERFIKKAGYPYTRIR